MNAKKDLFTIFLFDKSYNTQKCSTVLQRLPLYKLHNALGIHEEHVSLCTSGERGSVSVYHIGYLLTRELTEDRGQVVLILDHKLPDCLLYAHWNTS